MVTFDLQTLLICLIVFLASAFLIYVIVALTMRETTFEQVMEEQKRKQEAQLSKTKEPKKEKKKKNFKKGKAGYKGMEESERREEIFKEEKMVELEISPEYIEVSDSGSASTPPKKSKAGKVQAKSILSNKDAKIVVGKEAPELFHRKNVPKDEMELKHEKEQIFARNGKEESAAKALEPVRPPPPEVKKESEVIRAVETQSVDVQKTVAAAPQPVKKDKKKKPPQDVNNEAASEIVEKVSVAKMSSSPPEMMNGCETSLKPMKNKAYELNEREFLTSERDSLLASVHLAQLNDSDIKSLIEVLIGKVSNPDALKGLTDVDWTKKGQKVDPAMNQLRRQLEEKERALDEEKQRSFMKTKELNQELMSERQSLTALAKRNQEQAGEFQALQARMQDMHVHMQEIGHLRGQLEAKTKQTNDAINQNQRLKEDIKMLQDAVAKAQHLASTEKANEELRTKVQLMDSALQQQSIQRNSAENALKSSENKAKQLEERIREYETLVRESKTMAQRCHDLEDELDKSEKMKKSMTLELEKQAAVIRNCDDDRNRCINELKSKEGQLSDLNRHAVMSNSTIDELRKNNQMMEVEIQGLKAELQEARHAVRETAASQQLGQEKVAFAAHDEQTSNAVITEKDLALKQNEEHLNEKLKELESVSDELNSFRNRFCDLESENKNLLRTLEESKKATHEWSVQQNAEAEELKKLNAKLATELLSHNLELDHLSTELNQKSTELENAKQESSSIRQELSRLINELQQKDAEVEKARSERDALRNHNAVLSECQQNCEELKMNLVSLSEQLQQKEAEQNESEAQLMQLREKEAKWAESEASFDTVKTLETRLAEKETEFLQLQQTRDQAGADDEKQQLILRLEEYDMQVKELREREAEWIQKETKWDEVDTQLQQQADAVSRLAAAEDELRRLKEERNKYAEVEADLRQTLEATEANLAARELDLTHLQGVSANVVETELQLMELRQKSSDLQKLNDKYGSLDKLEVRLMQLAEKEAKFAQSEARDAANEEKLQKMEDELRQIKSLLVTQEAESEEKLRKVEEELANSRIQQQHFSVDEATRTEPEVTADHASMLESGVSDNGKPSETVGHKEVTVFTHVQEKATWDMTKLVLDLDTKEVEIQILQSVLSKKESTIKEMETDKSRLMEMIENMQMELWAKDKQIKELETRKSTSTDDVEKELAEARKAQNDLQNEVEHYQSILADTEKILRQLESNVDSEEQKWRQKYNMAVEENERLQEEVIRLKGVETQWVSDETSA